MTTAATNCEKLFSCYYAGLSPPNWSATPDESMMRRCKVFYHEGDSRADVARLVREREPVNMTAHRMYHQDRLLDHFGFQTGHYGSCGPSANDITPPNFIVYTPTEIRVPDGPTYPAVHILNAIGLAFDSEDQPDYKTYHKLADPVTDKDDAAWEIGGHSSQLRQCALFYERLFTLIFETARRLGKPNIVMSFVGANNFALYWAGGPEQFRRTVWAPTFNDVAQRYPDLNIMFTGAVANRKARYKNVGMFPKLLEHPDIKNKLDDTLLINAWDCWSVPGNGNERDNSLDGYMGRFSQIGVNGTSLTNPYLAIESNYVSI